MVPAPWRINSRGMRAVFLQNRFTHRPHPENAEWWFYSMFFLFFSQSGAVFFAICYISKLKSLIGVLFDAFWIPDLLAICCILELKSLICMLFAAFLDYDLSCISEPKSQIWVAKIVHLHENCNIFPGFSTMVFIWMVFIDFLIVFSDLSMVSKVP